MYFDIRNNMKIKFILVILGIIYTKLTFATSINTCNNIIYSISGYKNPYYRELTSSIDKLPEKLPFINQPSIVDFNNFDEFNEQYSKINNYIKEKGFSAYYTATREGNFPSSIYNPIYGDISILDMALLHNAEKKIIEEIKITGATLGKETFKVLYQNSLNRIKLIKENLLYMSFDLSELTFFVDNKKLDISTYTMLKKDFNTLKFLLNTVDGPNLSFSDDSDSISLDNFDFVEYSKLANIISIDDYQTKTKLKVIENKLSHQAKDKFERQLVDIFKYFNLIEVCSSNFKNLLHPSMANIEILFAINSNYIDQKYKEFRKNKLLSFKEIDKQLGNPLYSEVFPLCQDSCRLN